MNRPIFHLAFPINDVSETVEFYRDQLELAVDLIEEKRCIIDVCGHQVVAHVSTDDTPKDVTMYPRHFGLIFDDKHAFDQLLANAKKNKAKMFKDEFTRFPDSPREHHTFFLVDPSNNMLEFKWYKNSELIFKPA